MPADSPASTSRDRTRRPLRPVLLSLWLFTLSGCLFGWHFMEQKIQASIDHDRMLGSLVSESQQHLVNRRWIEAEQGFRKIDTLLPGSAISEIGRRAVLAGKQEEETQFLAYWIGQGLAELEAGRLNEAESALQNVLQRHPQHPEATQLLDNISRARIQQEIQSEIDIIRTMMARQEWDPSCQQAQSLSQKHPSDPSVAAVLKEATSGRKRHQDNLARAHDLFEQAKALDHGQFNQKALDLLREASLLSPDQPEIAQLLERMSSYTSTLRVPEDHPTPADALLAARDNDRIVIGAGSWKGPLVIRRPIKLQGQSPESTIVSCPADAGNTLTIMAPNVEIDGITFQHETLQSGPGDRFSTVALASGNCQFRNCHFIRGSGHGLAVLHGSHAMAQRCKFLGNAWNGAAATGQGSSLIAEDCESSNNFQNGFEAWQGATAKLSRNTISGNTRNGIHIDVHPSDITCTENTISRNREFGICASSAGSGKIEKNQITQNLLGGILIRTAAAKVEVLSNESTENQGPDLILERGLAQEPYADNQLTKQRTAALKVDVVLDP